MAADYGGIEWLYELLQDVQLEQFFTRIRDDLQVILLGERKICLNVKNYCCFNIETVFFLLCPFIHLLVFPPDSVADCSVIDND
jgi:hypothetical protein